MAVWRVRYRPPYLLRHVVDTTIKPRLVQISNASTNKENILESSKPTFKIHQINARLVLRNQIKYKGQTSVESKINNTLIGNGRKRRCLKNPWCDWFLRILRTRTSFISFELLLDICPSVTSVLSLMSDALINHRLTYEWWMINDDLMWTVSRYCELWCKINHFQFYGIIWSYI